MKINNILLLTVESDEINTSGTPLEIDSARGNYPPLGLIYIASELLKNGYNVKILDLASFGRSKNKLTSFIRNFNPEIIGFQLYSTSIRNAIKLAELIKTEFPSITVIAGGPHLDAYPSETISLPCFDIGILGEGSKRLVNVLKIIESEKTLSKSDGVVYKLNGKVIVNKSIHKSTCFNKMPFPARQTLVDKNYSSIFENKFTSIVASRGCHYSCTFCSEIGTFRLRTPENVIKEIEHYVKVDKINNFYFLDSTFPVNNLKWIKRFCNEIIKNKLKIMWSVRTRPDHINEKSISLMKKAGCNRLQLGIESANHKSLEFLNKRMDLRSAEKGINIAKKHGLTVLSYFIIGFPDEKRNDVLNTIRYARKIKTDYAHFSLLTPIPNTKLYDYVKKNKLMQEDYWLDYMTYKTDELAPVCSKYLGKKELTKLLGHAYKNFYINPNFIFRRGIDILREEKPFIVLIKYFSGLRSLLRIRD